MPPVNGFFLAIIVLALGFFSYNVQRLLGYLQLGRLDDVRWNAIPTRVGNFLRIGIFQEKIFRDSIAGPMHALIFWGFLVLGASTTEFLIGGVFPGFGYDRFLPEPVYRLYVLSQEGFAAIVLAMVAMALWRRLTHRVPRLEGAETHPNDPLLILSWIAALMITMFLAEAFHFVASPDDLASAFPVSYPVAKTLVLVGFREGMPAPQLMHDLFWWAHALLVLGFLNYLPYSKHLHVVVSLPNTFLSNTSGPGTVGTMRALDFEGRDAEQFGASDVEHLSWKSLLDGFACTECGRCTSVCPANTTGKLLSPRKIMINVRERLEAKKREIQALYLADLRSGQESNDSPTEDIVDRANNAYSRELNFSISDAERTLMLQVEEAIRRVDEGGYGRCANCGDPIARLRLEAVPWARFCIGCQELLEQGMLTES